MVPKEASSFEKSAPASYPSTREQGVNSAWDVDLSPFHRIVNEQNAITTKIVASLGEINSKISILLDSSKEKDDGSVLEEIALQNKSTQELLEQHQSKILFTLQILENQLSHLQKLTENPLREFSLNPEQFKAILEKNEQIFYDIKKTCEHLSLSYSNTGIHMMELKTKVLDFLEESRGIQKRNDTIFWLLLGVSAIILTLLLIWPI